MKLGIRANGYQQRVLLAKGLSQKADITWLTAGGHDDTGSYNACFDFCYSSGPPVIGQTYAPVFVHAPVITADSMPENFVRMNTWPGFWENNGLEITGSEKIKEAAGLTLQALGWPFTWVPNQPGMISGRIVAMIINEAYFALQEGVSTQAEIDTAMKYGTNYPYGPFEWAEKIGLKEIYALLTSMGVGNNRYTIAPALQKAANEQ
ncbi:3-hydroxyacyl-CoA dehydrogenase family protein [Foetidibacter luteolus]|uniref:3-hydroxyacyl-CoA dehydrogenase family protein n=1 Tax=Foetidibacter luteolus TaxID=2608880 RepID=UPI001A9913F8|nr:3-hydroxyacyl-CoA dehydrogenase family protein [Foetidibacter luteolus]